MYRLLRIGPWPNSTIRSSPAVRSTNWTRSKGCHRCAAAARKFARFTCGYNRLVTPSWALFFVKAPFRSLRTSSNMGCSIWMVCTLAPTWVSVLRTAACIRQVPRCPWRPTTRQQEFEVKSPFFIQYHRAVSARSQKVRQGRRSQFGDPRASLTHLTAQLTFLDSVHGVRAAKSVGLSVYGVMFWLGINRARSRWLAKGHSCDQH